MLVELGLVEQRYKAVLEGNEGAASVTESLEFSLLRALSPTEHPQNAADYRVPGRLRL